jgi:FtsZ-binding cell division protein ZapB
MKKLILLTIPLLFLWWCSLPNKNLADLWNISIEKKLNDTLDQINSLKNQNLNLEQMLQDQIQRIQTLLQENEQLKQEIEKYKQMLGNMNTGI